ncbi:MAG: FtsW/RodA/SpoVE family cell cycle protein [Sulfuriferula sp.]
MAQEGRGTAALVRRHRPDYQIVLYMGLLMLIGLIIIYAIGPQRANVLNNSYGTDFYSSAYFFIKQTISLFLALVAFTIAATIPYQLLQRHAGKILVAGFAACALLVFFGNVIHVDSIAQCSLGACRWFSLGPLGSLQPAELLKFGLLVFTAGFLGARAQQGLVNDRTQTLVPLGILVGIALVVIIGIQKDMGTGIALVAMLSAMLLMAGLKLRIWLMIAAIMIGVGILFILIAPHRIDRVTTFLSGDESSVDDAGSYHITHAKIAIGSGGIAGVGIGNSIQATGYLPEAINDSVFAILGETFGFVGLVAILGLFTALLLRLLKVADHLMDIRLRLLVAGVFGWLGAHVILNVGAMIGIIPLTGITLPLLSFGGTSMVFIAGALGLAFQLSRYTAFGSKLKDNEYEDSQRRGRIGRSRNPSRRRTA